MDNLFKDISIEEFDKKFESDENCYKFLADNKWKYGFVCRKCGNSNYCKGKKPFSRRCTRCKTEESTTSHTIFHRCKIGLKEAFTMAFLVCNSPKISSYELSRRINLRHMTCFALKKKIMECLLNKHGFIPEIQKDILDKL